MGGKSSGELNDYYGHAAGCVCQGQLDFIVGLLINNNLSWPNAALWSFLYNPNQLTLYTDGNIYRTLVQTNIDPPASPWTLYAAPWSAGTYTLGTNKLHLGNIWTVGVASTSLTPPAVAPRWASGKRSKVQSDSVDASGWKFIAVAPVTWTLEHSFLSGAIVAYEGRLYVTSANTSAEPPSSPWSLWKQDLSGSNPFKFTVDPNNGQGYGGDCYLYTGRDNQTLDTVYEQVLSSLGHPAYRNKSILVLKNFKFGTEQQNAPDCIIVGGRSPVQTLITGASTDLDADWQANPWCILAELLTHPAIGMGLPDSFFDATSWQAEADRCAANPELYYISPIYSSLKKVREVVTDLMGYPDAFVFWTTLATLAAGHWPHGEADPAFDATNTVDHDALTEGLKWDSDVWGDTFSTVQLSFQDIQSGFKSRPVFSNNLFNQSVVKRAGYLTIDRPHIVRQAQAMAWAVESAKLAGEQKLKGQVVIRAEKAAAVSPGKIFLLTDDTLQLSQAQRCTAKVTSAPPAGTVKLTHETERGLQPLAYSAGDSAIRVNKVPPSRSGNWAVVQLPAELGNAQFSIAVLAGRTDDVTTSLDIYFRQNDAASFQLLGTNRAFAVPGVFDIDENTQENIGYTDNTALFAYVAMTQGVVYDLGTTGFWKNVVSYRIPVAGLTWTAAVEGVDYVIDPVAGTIMTVIGGGIPSGDWVKAQLWTGLVIEYEPLTPQNDLDSIMESLTADEIADGHCLLFAFQAANPELFEVMSIKSVATPGVGVRGGPVLFAGVNRCQFGTLTGGDGTHVWGSDPNDVVFIMKKSGIDTLNHELFPALAADNSTMTMRTVPNSAWVNGDINDVYDIASNPSGVTDEFTYGWENLYAPVVSWQVLFYDGAAITDFTAAFLSTKVFSFTFQIDDLNASLAHGSLVAIQGQQEVTLWASNFTGTQSVSKTVNFSLPTGTWLVVLRALDLNGNQTEAPLKYSGSEVSIIIGAAVSQVPSLVRGPTSRGTNHNSLLQIGNNTSTLYYQVQNGNAAFNPSSWIACALFGGTYLYGDTAFGNYLPPIGSNKTLYAYSTHAGDTDSAVAMWYFG